MNSLVTQVLLLFVLLAPAGCTAHIPETSKTRKCREEIDRALQTLSQVTGIPANSHRHRDDILEKGEFTEQYAIAGSRYRSTFSLRRSLGGEWYLGLYKQVTVRPGTYESASGNYGDVELTACQCIRGSAPSADAQ